MNADKALAWPGVGPRYSGDTGQGKGGIQEFQPVAYTVRNGLSGYSVRADMKTRLIAIFTIRGVDI
ncbi:MAG: hypothetical protein KGY80_12450 [Candidatus Thorarchaeota archaeon]|nr:hypothetical protein [Candidatus Thorarchaeota archaeon]